ncbi:hybrid sensor histidine kinase/response regulator [Gemmatimonas groenlandica]|uniref:histidine kinase n=1 Tax=Gemmatimonas groenlandica TaxID=2732249 RepID=A0A6M4IL88_9BACT|nr:PAS domain-containing sensor histidine kinase [Gemmatimonas groenlandica]QJR34297.1 response regulator [Gemmatimonas groenlandica]
MDIGNASRNDGVQPTEPAEQTLLAREALFRTLAESSPTGVFLADAHGTPTYANQRLLDWFGLRLDEFATGRWLDCVHPADVAQVRAGMERSIGKAQSFDEEYRVVVDGHVRWIRVRTQAVMCPKGTTVIGQVGSVLDTTGERAAADERDRLQVQLEEVRRLESLGLLAGGVAHDFNNLLVGILGNASLARAVIPLDARGHEVLTDIEQAAHRASELTKHLLAYAGRARVERRTVIISDLVADVPRQVGAYIPSVVSLAIELPPSSPIVDGDETQLRRVLLSLITNSVEAFGDGHGRVDVTVSREHLDAAALSHVALGTSREPGWFAVITVRDTGIGMSADVQAKMFDPFFTTKGPGRGLGLASTLGILNGHDGAIGVTSQHGHGTTMRVLLPLVRGLTPYPGTPVIDAFARVESGVILLVDDDTGARTAARRILTRVGYTVVEAADGREALDLYDRMTEPPRGVVLDLAMPVMGGAECLRQLRLRGSVAPVLLISGYDAEDEAQGHVRRGEARFLQKPYTARGLLDALHDTLAPV